MTWPFVARWYFYFERSGRWCPSVETACGIFVAHDVVIRLAHEWASLMFCDGFSVRLATQWEMFWERWMK